MKTSELRIGNWVIYEATTRIITSIGEYDVLHYLANGKNKSDMYASPISQISPIPLTPEILEKVGFEYDGIAYNLRFYTNMDLTLVTYNEDGMHYWLKYYYGPAMPHIRHLHQLQNLYFALTGEELDIKL